MMTFSGSDMGHGTDGGSGGAVVVALIRRKLFHHPMLSMRDRVHRIRGCISSLLTLTRSRWRRGKGM